MDHREQQKGRRKLLAPIIIGMVICAVSALAALVILFFFAPPAASPEAKEPPVVVEPKPTGISSNVLFFGNAFWGRYINDWSMASPLKTAYPFSRLDEFKRQDYNAWFAGLECPTVPGDTMSSAEMDQTLSFNCSPDYLPEAKKWFTGFTLANNHTDNRGVEGFAETKRQLDTHGIQYFGHYDPYDIDDICEVIALPVTVRYDNGTTKDEALPVAMCGYHMVFKLAPESAYRIMERYAKVMPVIAFPHMGAEYMPAPDALKTQTYRKLIDHGADVVLGDHPHAIQTTEAYKGRLIVYSMGNFMFDQQDSAEVTQSAAIRLLLEASAETDKLTQWLAVGATCTTFKDDCLEKIEKQNLEKLPATYLFSVVGTNDGGKIVKPADKAHQARILERLRWARTASQLREPYKAR